MTIDAEAAVAAASAAIGRGDLITAYDLASAAHAAVPSRAAAYLVVLSLARMGDTAGAQARYTALGLDRAIDVDTRALGARLTKDLAVTASGAERASAFAAASAAYDAIYDATGDFFPGINAASLALLAGDVAAAHRMATALLDRLPQPADFWGAATRAEALMLLGRDAEAAAALTAGDALPGANFGARSTTLRQFELLAAGAGLDGYRIVRDALHTPTTMFYCGHMFASDPLVEARLGHLIDAALTADRIEVGYGALACGTDIVVAERLLARGGELNVMLPFDVTAFIAASVDPGGPEWRARFDACLARATSLRIASEIGDIGDPQAFSHASLIAMGMVRLRARQLGGAAKLLAVWDGAQARGFAGTAVDLETWQAAGGEAVMIPAGVLDRALARPKLPPAYDGPPRDVLSLIFGDVVGFARLKEVELPRFWREVMGAAAEILDAQGRHVRARNGWGDAIYAVIDHPAVAAAIVLDLQERLAETGNIASRIGVHYGAVFATPDPITGRPTFYGTEVARAARIEPVTPPGQVYVTESFAAALAMASGAFACRYVGQVELAKNYGAFPMYRLTRA